MEGKSLVMSALLLSLVLGQIQVEAKSCCPSNTARNIFDVCRMMGSRDVCAKTAGCKIQDPPCPTGWDHDILENTGVYEYCKLGCSSSVCGAIITLQKSDESGVVSGAVEKCTQACSVICTKPAPIIAAETA